MVTSKAKTVTEYLAGLPADRRESLQRVREVVLQNLDDGYEEGMQYGMIGYFVPHRLYPPGYRSDPKQPLPFAGLASQKNYMSLYLTSTYSIANFDPRFRVEWAKTGKKMDMGKSCIRFKKIEDLPLDVIGGAIARLPAKTYIAQYKSACKTQSTKIKKKT